MEHKQVNKHDFDKAVKMVETFSKNSTTTYSLQVAATGSNSKLGYNDPDRVVGMGLQVYPRGSETPLFVAHDFYEFERIMSTLRKFRNLELGKY